MSSETHKSPARDVFLYLLTIVTLYLNVWALIDLLFEYVNILFPDPLNRPHGWPDPYHSIRWSMASLIIVFPVYIGLSWFLRKDIIAHPEKREMRVRKWLFHLTLFLAAVTIITDLVTLVNRFLEGELTTKFLLKVLIVLVVAGGVFAYYFWDLRRQTTPTAKPSLFLAGFATAIVLASMIGGFFIIGSPFTHRLRKFDAQRIQDLQNIHSNVIEYWKRRTKLPIALEDLQNEFGFTAPKDPVTKAPYEYRVLAVASNTATLQFELCAIFEVDPLPSQDPREKFSPPPYFPIAPYEYWNYKSGRTCFARKISELIEAPHPVITTPTQKLRKVD